MHPDSGMGSVILAEMGTNVLEFSSVSRITGDPTYREKAEKGLRAVHAANQNVRWPHGRWGRGSGARSVCRPFMSAWTTTCAVLGTRSRYDDCSPYLLATQSFICALHPCTWRPAGIAA